ncbi:MAG: HpcH/HpaI aldolase family protein [Microbacterium sp.]
MSAPSLRARAIAGERLIGVLVRMPSEELVEMAALSGFDFVLIDCEHGPADVIALRQHIAAAAAHGLPTLVRTGTAEHPLILRALDQGASGIVAPHVDSVDDARRLVGACHYPPLGTRGFATYSRAGGFGTSSAAAHRERLRESTIVIGMIESPSGVAAADDIAGVDGVDGLMTGPSDLAATSGPDDLPVAEAERSVHDAARAAGRLRVDIVPDADAARAAFDAGAGIVVYNLAHSLMGHLAGLASARD